VDCLICPSILYIHPSLARVRNLSLFCMHAPFTTYSYWQPLRLRLFHLRTRDRSWRRTGARNHILVGAGTCSAVWLHKRESINPGVTGTWDRIRTKREIGHTGTAISSKLTDLRTARDQITRDWIYLDQSLARETCLLRVRILIRRQEGLCQAACSPTTPLQVIFQSSSRNRIDICATTRRWSRGSQHWITRASRICSR